MADGPRGSLRSALIAAGPLALAIGVFGIVFGAAGTVEFGAALAIGMSLIVFSGAVQFAVLGLLAGGAGALAILSTVLALNARNLVLGAVLRARLGGPWWRRAGLAWFLVDESFGLAIAARARTATVLLVTGVLFYVAWQAGTLLGVLGAQAVALEEVATAVFPVLFIGLAAITVNGRDGVLRAAGAGLLVVAVAILVPELPLRADPGRRAGRPAAEARRMSWELLLGLAALTYGSRAVALVLLPNVPPSLAAILDRMPSALFAALAAHALVAPGGVPAEAPVLAAAAGAMVVTPFRSVPICLAAGLAAFGLASLIA